MKRPTVAQIDWKKCEKDFRPSVRVERAMKRLSRDRWLPPREAADICWVFSGIVASHGGRCSVYRAAMSSTCEHVGMIEGKPPLALWDEGYADLLYAVDKLKKKYGNKPIPPLVGEMAIMEAIVRGKSWKKK